MNQKGSEDVPDKQQGHSEALVVEGEASESEDESSEEVEPINKSPTEDSRLSMGGYILSSVTAVEKKLGALSRQATRDLDSITKGQMRRSSTFESGDERESTSRSPTQKTLLHKKLFETNMSLHQNCTSIFQNSFMKNDGELKKVKADMDNTEYLLQGTTMSLQHTVHYCNEINENLRKLNSLNIKLPN